MLAIKWNPPSSFPQDSDILLPQVFPSPPMLFSFRTHIFLEIRFIFLNLFPSHPEMWTPFLKENTKVPSSLASSLSFKIKTPGKMFCPVDLMKGLRCNQCQTEGFQRHKSHWLDNELPWCGQRTGCPATLSITDTYLPDGWRSSPPFHSCLPLISL